MTEQFGGEKWSVVSLSHVALSLLEETTKTV